MMKVVKPKKIYTEPSLVGFFKAYFTLGAGDWSHVAYVTCGSCDARFEQGIHSASNWVVCPCCEVKNVW